MNKSTVKSIDEVENIIDSVEPNRVYTVAEVADLEVFSVSTPQSQKRTAYKEINKGRLNHIELQGRKRVRGRDIIDYLERTYQLNDHDTRA